MIVIADDITGAAEIAGIAFSKGHQVSLVCGSSACCDIVAAQTTVIATDTRSMTEAEAIAESHRIASHLSPLTTYLFKKTDSALRGHVVAELTALMEATGYQRAVYLPANPSKGRIIKNGRYYINNVPIHETDFSFDPEFPAKTSVLRERFPDAEAKGIIMPDAESEENIRRLIAEYNDGKTLFAGAADLFSALLNVNHGDAYHGDRPSDSSLRLANHGVSPLYDTLILCGSTQSKSLDLGIPIAPMPLEIYDGNKDLSLWDTSEYAKIHSLILTMPFTHRTGKKAAVHLRSMMAQKTKELITQHQPSHLIIEGGATAWATLQTLGWTQFKIVAQIAPGVVQMSATIACHTSTCGSKKRVIVTLKPGSYPWGDLFSSSADT
ncbi:MAG: four-carbon acid sugar kinase family protein [Prevotella sp.]|nr:four-carbon acid sugar kinase family protein [Prevotella sp.]